MAGTEALTANGSGAGPASNGPASGTATASTANNSTEVWSNLLKTVASSRLVPTKDVIILGDPHSGKSTLIELLKTALPTPTPDALANGVDGSKTANGVPSGPNGVATAANSAPIMVEMGTSTSEDGIVDGQKKNDLALSYSFWDVEDDENEGTVRFLLASLGFFPQSNKTCPRLVCSLNGWPKQRLMGECMHANISVDTVARLGLYQIAGSHKSYHALLKYCLNTNTIADTVVLIVLDWSKPWAFVETLERWVKVLDTAIKQILQEGAVATAAWTKGKAVMEELQEKCKWPIAVCLCHSTKRCCVFVQRSFVLPPFALASEELHPQARTRVARVVLLDCKLPFPFPPPLPSSPLCSTWGERPFCPSLD